MARGICLVRRGGGALCIIDPRKRGIIGGGGVVVARLVGRGILAIPWPKRGVVRVVSFCVVNVWRVGGSRVGVVMRAVFASPFRFVGGEKGVDRVALPFVRGGMGIMRWGNSMKTACPALVVDDATSLVGVADEAFVTVAYGVAYVGWPWEGGAIAMLSREFRAVTST